MVPFGEEQVLVPEDEMPGELLAEGQRPIVFRDEWQGRRGKFVGVYPTAVQAAVKAKTKGRAYRPDQRLR